MDKEAKHILVIDDDARLRALLQRFLRESGFFVSVSKSAEEARQLLQQYAFDLLIVDVMMPEESGIEFLVKLRKDNLIPV
ncbi:MAG: response regulator, partial [Alphaproteobacteria bacterium]|nr:response regulator [Alphaproteobacteria bacterium]